MIRGSCFCGSVKYESHGRNLRFLNCHCPDCRKICGSTYAAVLAVEAEGFKVVAGEEKLKPFQSSPGKLRSFCTVCGSQLFSRADSRPGIVMLRAGSLDDDPGVRPQANIWVKAKAPWHEILEDIPQFEEEFAAR